jgi:hypothetical protein
MTFRFTKDAKEKLRIPKLSNQIVSDNTIFEWFVGVFTIQRKKFFITTNAKTLYSVISDGSGICSSSKYFQLVLDDFFNQMLKDGLGKFFENYVKCTIDESICAKTNNRSILGSMNDLIFMSKMCLYEESVMKVTSIINKSPMSYINMDNPIDYSKRIIDLATN